MNIIQSIVQQHALMALRVPTGWLVSKNNYIDAGPEILDTIKDTQARFLATKSFFADTLFMASSERTLDSGIPIMATVDLWCMAPDDGNTLEYQVSVNLYKGKNKTSIFSQMSATRDRGAARDILDRWMHAFTWDVMYEFENAGLSIERYFSAS